MPNNNQQKQINNSLEVNFQTVKSESKNNSDYRILANKLRQKGNIEEAIKFYRHAIESDSKQPSWVYQHLGNLLSEQERHEEAVAVYCQAISLYPEDDSYYRFLAKFQRQTGDIKKAIKLYRHAIELDPKQPSWVYQHLGGLLSEQERHDEAVAVYCQAISLYPENVSCYKALAKAQYNTGYLKKAISSYLTAIEIEPEQSPEFYHYLAQIVKEQGELDLAISVKHKIIDLNEDLADEALTYLEKAILQLAQRTTNTKITTKTYTIYGNCQARVLASFLNSSELFKSHYQYVTIKPVHIINKNEFNELINDIVPKLNLFIFQPVSENYKGKEYSSSHLIEQLNTETQNISFPSCYFTGYNPEIKYLKDDKGRMITEQFDYHDLNIIQGFLESLSIEQVKEKIINYNYYPSNFSLTEIEKSLAQLSKRENNIFDTGKQIDIKISGFIRDNYKKNRLFNTINHPSKFIFKYIAEQILKLLDIEDNIQLDRDFLNHTIYPIYQSNYQNLKFDFANPMQYSIRECVYTLNDTIESYFDYYASLPKKILEINAV